MTEADPRTTDADAGVLSAKRVPAVDSNVVGEPGRTSTTPFARTEERLASLEGRLDRVESAMSHIDTVREELRGSPLRAALKRAESLQGSFAALAATVSDHAEAARALRNRVTPVEERLQEVEVLRTELGRLASAMADASGTVEQRLAAVELGMAGVPQRLDRVDRLATQTAADHEGFSEQITEQVGILRSRVTPVEEAYAEFTGLGAEMDRLAATTAAEHNRTTQRVNRRLDAVLEQLGSIEAQVTAVGDVRTDFGELAARTDTLHHERETWVAQRLDGFAAALHRHVEELDRLADGSSARQPSAYATLSDRLEELALGVAQADSRLGRLSLLLDYVQNLGEEVDRISGQLKNLRSAGSPSGDDPPSNG